MSFNKGLFNLKRVMSSNDNRKAQIVKNHYKYDMPIRDMIKVICSIESDEIKKECISYLISNGFLYERIISVICSIKDDLYKDDIIKEYEKYDIDISDAVAIVNSMSTEHIKKILFNHLEYSFTDRDIAKIVCNINDEEFKKAVILDYKYYCFDGEDVAMIVASLKDDNYKKEFLNVNSSLNSYCKSCILFSIKDDEYKYRLITEPSNYKLNSDDIAFIISGLSNTNKYIDDVLKHYKKYGFDLDVVANVVSLLSNEEKERIIFQNNYDFTPFQLCMIVKSFKDEKYRYRVLDKLYHNGFFGNKESAKSIFLPSNMTIGIEIESEGKNSGFITTDLLPKGWNVHEEVSLNYGTEIVSPILNNKNNEDIDKVCALLKSLSQEIKETCAGHIHIGSDYFNDDVECFKALLEIYSNTENLMFIISNKSGDKSRQKALLYANPITFKLVDSICNKGVNFDNTSGVMDFVNCMGDVQKNSYKPRYSSINFENMRMGIMNTIEFRIPNGTLASDVWIDNINLFGGLLYAAKKVANARKKSFSNFTDDDAITLYFYEKIKDVNITERDRLKCLLNLLPSEIDKTVYLDRYDINSKLIKNDELHTILTDMLLLRPIRITKCSQNLRQIWERYYSDSNNKKLTNIR